MDDNLLKFKKMYRAKGYMDSMCRGIDPVSKQPVPENSVIRQEKVVNCFRFLSKLLDELLSQYVPDKPDGAELPQNAETSAERKCPMTPFRLSREQVSRVQTTHLPIAVSTFIRNINVVLDRTTTKPIRAKDINGWLVEKGFVREDTVQVLKEDKEYALLDNAASIGLISETKQMEGGQADRHILKISREGQQFLLDNIDDIAEYAQRNK